jgi:hypothetical protein
MLALGCNDFDLWQLIGLTISQDEQLQALSLNQHEM